MAGFKFHCPACNQSLEAPAGMSGEMVECPSCKKAIRVPEAAPLAATPPMANQATKTCPRCGKTILAVAIKCKHCRSDVTSGTTAAPSPSTLYPPPVRVVLTESPPDGQVQWYYSLNGKRIGPVTGDDIRQLIAAGTLDNQTLAWKEGYDNWIPIGQTELKQTVRTTPPPLSGTAVNNEVVWTAAFVPIIGRLLQHIIAGATGTNEASPWFILIFLALNSTFCAIDERILKNAGHDTKKFGGWACWLVPVYLFRRAKALNQSRAYFVTWVVCFFISCA